MDLMDRLGQLASKIAKQKDVVATEEATKTAFIMPFISALGYDIFDPNEVIPEFTADVGIKKGEKVDYAIQLDGKIVMLIECKMTGVKLDVSLESQLLRYFNATEAKIGILTDGVIYKFYTDLDKAHIMDTKPFLEFSLLQVSESDVQEIKKFGKTIFNIDSILESANELRYTKEIKDLLNNQISNPTEDFVQFILKRVYSSNVTAKIKDQFTPVIKKAFAQLINEKIDARLKSAMTVTESSEVSVEKTPPDAAVLAPEAKIVTTDEEKEGFFIIKSLLLGTVALERVFCRDAQSYFSIFLDDSNRKPVARLYFNDGNKKFFSVFDQSKKEEKIAIEKIEDLYLHKEKIITSCKNYLENSADNS